MQKTPSTVRKSAAVAGHAGGPTIVAETPEDLNVELHGVFVAPDLGRDCDIGFEVLGILSSCPSGYFLCALQNPAVSSHVHQELQLQVFRQLAEGQLLTSKQPCQYSD